MNACFRLFQIRKDVLVRTVKLNAQTVRRNSLALFSDAQDAAAVSWHIYWRNFISVFMRLVTPSCRKCFIFAGPAARLENTAGVAGGPGRSTEAGTGPGRSTEAAAGPHIPELYKTSGTSIWLAL